MNYGEALELKKRLYPEHSIIGKPLNPNVYVVPQNENQFHFYLEQINKKKLTEISDAFAIEYCLNFKYALARIEISKKGIHFERLQVDNNENYNPF